MAPAHFPSLDPCHARQHRSSVEPVVGEDLAESYSLLECNYHSRDCPEWKSTLALLGMVLGELGSAASLAVDSDSPEERVLEARVRRMELERETIGWCRFE